MESIAIVYPSIAMALLTLGMIGYMGYSRYTAIQARQVSIKYYRTYNEGEQTPRLHLIGRHIQNHFEVPPLFHLGVALTYMTDSVSALAVVLAWGYFIARCVHSYIHLGPNNVSVRFFTFGASLVMLLGMWLCLLVVLLRT